MPLAVLQGNAWGKRTLFCCVQAPFTKHVRSVCEVACRFALRSVGVLHDTKGATGAAVKFMTALSCGRGVQLQQS